MMAQFGAVPAPDMLAIGKAVLNRFQASKVACSLEFRLNELKHASTCELRAATGLPAWQLESLVVTPFSWDAFLPAYVSSFCSRSTFALHFSPEWSLAFCQRKRKALPGFKVQLVRRGPRDSIRLTIDSSTSVLFN